MGAQPCGNIIPEEVLPLGLGCVDVSFSWLSEPDKVDTITGISLDASPGEFVSVIGPTGCGKSTLLYLLSGLMVPASGAVYLDGKPLVAPDRNIGLVFQHYTLFPWLTVQSNVEFGMKLAGVAPRERHDKALEILNRVGLLSSRSKYPHQLSGGMQQRTAIARVLANDSQYLLMDEPFGALDLQTRLIMQRFLSEIWQEFQRTILFVTHQVEEAVQLSDRVILMSSNPGRIAGQLRIEIPRPRDPSSNEFNDYRRIIGEHLRREVELIFRSQSA
jgi:NitT/TauT family transport system ATP-binding protein